MRGDGIGATPHICSELPYDSDKVIKNNLLRIKQAIEKDQRLNFSVNKRSNINCH